MSKSKELQWHFSAGRLTVCKAIEHHEYELAYILFVCLNTRQIRHNFYNSLTALHLHVKKQKKNL